MPKKNEIEILVREVNGSCIVDLGGEIDLYRSPIVRKRFEELLHKNPRKLLINLKQVSYMDSSGLATLIEAFQIAKKKNVFFGLFAVSTGLQGLFEITRLEKVFQIYKDEIEALKGI